MSNSTSTLPLLVQNQASAEITANNLFDAGSVGMLFGRNQSTSSGLTWGFLGGNILVDGAFVQVANGTLALTASLTNYIEATRAGVVSRNTVGFTAGQIPLYEAVVGAATVISYTDRRSWMQIPQVCGKLVKAVSGATNATLTALESRCQILEFTGALTAQINVVLPLPTQQWTVFNNTTGGFGIQFIGATGTGTVVAATKRAIIYSDGTNVVRASLDA